MPGPTVTVRMGEEGGRADVLARAPVATVDLVAVPDFRLGDRHVELRVRTDEFFMDRVLQLAAQPAHTSPNPRVAAIVVKDDVELASGIHRGAGTPHAEALALEGIEARGATMYVNLEPCNHHGLMPPCAPSLVEAGIERVVIGIQDPDRRVSGQGIRALREAGIGVTVGVLEDAARRLNAPFLHHRSTGSSFLTLKLALSLDGKLAAPDGTSRWITGEEARRRVHERRLEADAVLVGSGTVLKDDPSLTVRHVESDRQPLRVVADASGRVPASASIFSDGRGVLMVTTARCPHDVQMRWKEAGGEVLVLPEPDDRDGSIDIRELLRILGQRDVVEVYCEGGATLATSLLRADLVDRLELYRGPLMIGGSGPGIGSLGVDSMSDAVRWSTQRIELLGDDTLVTLERRR